MPGNSQGAGDTAVNKNMHNPGPCKASPTSGEMGLWVNIPEIVANYNHGWCHERGLLPLQKTQELSI